MGNLVRACLGREYSFFQLQARTTLSWDMLMVFKVICYALFDVTRRSASYSEDNGGARRCSAPAQANLLRLLYRRHVLKSKVDTLSRWQSFSKETSCKCSFDNGSDNGSSVHGEKEVADSPQSRTLEVLNRLNSEVQTLKSKLDRQEEQVQKLTEEVLSLRASAASSPVQSPKGQLAIGSPIVPAPANVVSDASCEDSNPNLDVCLSKGGHLVKLENVYMFQPVSSKPQEPVHQVRLCTSQDSGSGKANLEHYATDLPSPRKVGTQCVWEHSLECRPSPVKVQSNARRGLDCKCVDYLDREFVLDAVGGTEIEAEELDNLSMYSYDSADTRDFQGVATPKFLGRGDDLQEQMEWSFGELRKDPIMRSDESLPWTNTDAGTAARRRQVQQRHNELEEKLLKVFQSPRREILPQVINSNFSSCSSSGGSSPRSTSSASGRSHAGQSGGGLFWEPSRKAGWFKPTETLCLDKKFHTDIDFATETSKTYGASNSSKGQTHPSLKIEFGGGEFDSNILLHPQVTLQDEKVVNPDLTREESSSDSTQIHRQRSAISGDSFRESYGSSPAVDPGDENRGELDIDEVALETFKVCESGDIFRCDSRKGNRYEREDVVTPADSNLYRESQGSSTSCGRNRLRRHSSFSQGTRQSRFAVEAARLSMRKQGHQRGMSF